MNNYETEVQGWYGEQKALCTLIRISLNCLKSPENKEDIAIVIDGIIPLPFNRIIAQVNFAILVQLSCFQMTMLFYIQDRRDRRYTSNR